MDTVNLLEELANKIRPMKHSDLAIAHSNLIFQAVQFSDAEIVRQQFGKVGYLAHFESVVHN